MLTREQALENLGAEEVAHRQEAERLWLAYELAWRAHSNAVDLCASPDEIASLKAQYDTAEAAWFDCETNGDIARINDDGEHDEPARCALTNCIIHEEDEYLEYNGTGRYLLVAALGLEDAIVSALTGSDDDDAANDDSEAA